MPSLPTGYKSDDYKYYFIKEKFYQKCCFIKSRSGDKSCFAKERCDIKFVL